MTRSVIETAKYNKNNT